MNDASNADNRSEKEIFFAALEQPTPEARAAFLDGACGKNPVLRQRVEKLLADHFEDDSFLQTAAVESPPTETVSTPVQEGTGAKVGRYKLLQKIGEGGCGIVYMADQTEPVRRRVALKIIKLGMDSRQVVARFEAERQALAMMDHPSIARVLDAGATDTGRPYFVMELVRGIKITDYCDQNQLTTAERLRLFIQVCQAVQHAHQKGIIHRDLKPSNILVTSDDGVPLPKVIDFGIAKATANIQLTDKTLFTRFEMFIGTPAYMSPEQAEFNASDIDTRTDIYALGVLLYELLTGQTPFDTETLLKSGIDGMRKMIRETEPVRPSTKLTMELAASKGPSSATNHRAPTKELIEQLRGDLDWIVLKALEKDRTRRYDTANGLARDIERYLTNEPVVARPPSTAYKIQKAWQRHKLAFTAGAAVTLALVVGTGVSVWQAVRATKAQKSETQQRVAAQEAQAAALVKQKEAEEMRRLAEARAYAADMNLAQQALAADNLGLATELLDRHRPQPGQSDRRGWEWRYLWQHSRSDALYTLCQQTNWIAGLTVSHDGKWLGVRTVSGDVSVWNLASRREVMRAEGKWNAVAFSPTKPVLAMWNTSSPGEKSWLSLWDAETGKYISDAPSPTTSDPALKCGLAFLSDGNSVLASTRNDLTLWQVSDGKKLADHLIQISGFGIGFPVNMARNTNLFAVAGADLRIQVINVTSGREIFSASAPGHGWLESVALSADGHIMATCSGTSESVVRLWDVASGRELGFLEGHRGYVSALAFWPDGKTLASGSADKTIRIWDVENRRTLTVLRGHQDEVHRLALLPDNSTLISGGKDGTVMIWTNVTVRRKQAVTLTWKTGPHRIFRARWSLDSRGETILTIEPDGRVTRWHGRDFQDAEMLFQVDPGTWVSFSTDHRWLATRVESGDVKIWDVAQRKRLRDLPLSNGPISDCKFLAATTKVAVWAKDAQTLAIHDAVTGNPITSWSHPELGGTRPHISADGQWCITSDANGTGRIRELTTGRQIGTVPLDRSKEMAFSPDGKQLAISYSSGLLRRWEVPALTEREPLRGFSCNSLAFSPDRRRLAVGGWADYSLKLWDVESGRPMLTFPGESDNSESMNTVFSSDGDTIAVLHGLGTFDIWRAPSWEEIAAAEAKEQAATKKP